jgi:hypothetical protein
LAKLLYFRLGEVKGCAGCPDAALAKKTLIKLYYIEKAKP